MTTKYNETLDVVGEAVTKEVYRVAVGSHVYEGRRVWSVYCGNTHEASAKTYEEALEKAEAIRARLHGREIIHNKQ